MSSNLRLTVLLLATLSLSSYCSDDAKAQSGPIRIGEILPQTGPLAPGGKDGIDALALYLASVDNTIAGRKLEVIVADDAGNPELGITKARQLVESDKVHVLIGFFSTAVCNAVAGYIKDAHIPMLATVQCGSERITFDPKLASPYLARWSNSTGVQADTSAHWAYSAGYRKVSIITSDFAAGAEFLDLFSSVFVTMGGTIVQEQHPPLGTNDFGPYLAQLSPEADLIVVFGVGTDGLRFGQQYRNYVNLEKVRVFDLGGQISSGSSRAQLGDNLVGMLAMSSYSLNYPTGGNEAFKKAWNEKYPGRGISQEAANGYAGGQVLDAALTKVGGRIEDTQAFLDALHTIELDTVRGPVKLDSSGSVVVDNYFMEFVKGSEGTVVEKPLKTYKGISLSWVRTPLQLQNFPYGTLKGKWVGMTKEKLGDVVTLPKQ
jgi:branched-chain amino acid transport system substrate-binding protein